MGSSRLELVRGLEVQHRLGEDDVVVRVGHAAVFRVDVVHDLNVDRMRDEMIEHDLDVVTAVLDAGGRVKLAGDPRHHWVNPVLYKREDAEACWRALRAPLLMILGEHSEYLGKLGADGTAAAFLATCPGIEIARLTGAGHMLHIERPDLAAPLIETFLDAH